MLRERDTERERGELEYNIRIIRFKNMADHADVKKKLETGIYLDLVANSDMMRGVR